MRTAWSIFLGVLALTLFAELFVPAQGHFAVEGLFGWNALYGFLACGALILAAKAIGVFLKRPEDYFDD